jgi:xylitol oxidase
VIAAVEKALVPLGARTHWAKLTAMTGSEIRSGYRRAPDFRELTRKFDPDGKFGNDFVDELFPASIETSCPQPTRETRAWKSDL